MTPAEARQAAQALAATMRTQDHRATAWPVYVVQQRRRIYGMSTDYAEPSEVVWLEQTHDSAEASPEDAARMEAQHDLDGTEPEGWTRTAYLDLWEHVTTCFTEDGANAYITANRHNLKAPRVYVESAHRNTEWQTVVRVLRVLGVPEPPREGAMRVVWMSVAMGLLFAIACAAYLFGW